MRMDEVVSSAQPPGSTAAEAARGAPRRCRARGRGNGGGRCAGVVARGVNAARQEVERLERERYETAARPAAEGGGRGDAAGER